MKSARLENFDINDEDRAAERDAGRKVLAAGA